MRVYIIEGPTTDQKIREEFLEEVTKLKPERKTEISQVKREERPFHIADRAP